MYLSILPNVDSFKTPTLARVKIINAAQIKQKLMKWVNEKYSLKTNIPRIRLIEGAIYCRKPIIEKVVFSIPRA